MLAKKKILFGILIVFIIAICWVFISQINKNIQVSSKLEAPFFIVWWNANFYLIFLIFIFIKKKKVVEKLQEDNLTLKTLFANAMLFYILWVAANYTFMRALSMISSSDVTAVFSATPAFVFILSVILIKEEIKFLKVLAVLLAISGVICVATSSGDFGEKKSILAYFLVIVSSISSASYQTLLKKIFGHINIYSYTMLLVFISTINLTIFWFVWLVLDLTNLEKVILNKSIIIKLFLTAVVSVFYNALINFGIIYTYPLFISLGVVMGIPLNVLVDYGINNLEQKWLKILGCGLIIVGFVSFVLNNLYFDRSKSYMKKKSLDLYVKIVNDKIEIEEREETDNELYDKVMSP